MSNRLAQPTASFSSETAWCLRCQQTTVQETKEYETPDKITKSTVCRRCLAQLSFEELEKETEV